MISTKIANSKLEVRDVEVDSEATVIRWPKGHATKLTSFKESNSEIQTSCSDIAKSTMDITKIQKEEPKIIAWESQQKAKAKATIRKLEMKLEKKRSSSMDKILNKLRRAQMKAEKMRSSMAMP
ncbi:remorin-like [Arachis ipaensis]|uniref:remorin-like n=1 Tax=Arachis ipaensis TaxID=130454 RepID=UPI0007AF0028|nr:remorin-like [Arachis ipaensis]